MNTKSINIENILRPSLLLAIGLTIGLIIGIGIGKSNIAPSLVNLRGVDELNQLTASRAVNPRAVTLPGSDARLARAAAPGVAALDLVDSKVEDVDSLDVLDGRLVV